MLRKLWNRFGRRAATSPSRARPDYRSRLSVEPLEERRLLTMWAIFNTTIDPGDMKLDRNGENRLFILGDESGDSMTIGVDVNDNVTVDGSDQIYRGWNDTTNLPNNLGTVAASSVKAIAADLGKGNDTLDLSAVTSAKFTGLVDGNIIISGGLGDDIITGSGFRDVISGDGGADTINGGDGDDLIHGGDGDDTLSGNDGDDVISGGDGDDVISAGAGLDVVNGNGFKDGVDQGDLVGSLLNEASGMIIGRKTTSKARIWTIEDSGNDNVRLWVNDLDGVSRGYHPFDTATVKVRNVDWEALAFYEDTGGKKWIYIGDIGNNNPNNDVTHTIYRTEEPTTTDTQTGAQSTIANSVVERIVFDYPFGYDHDAETLMVDPITGDIYIVSKRERVTGEEGSLYKIAAGAANWTVVTSAAPSTVTATDLGEITTNTLAPSPQDQNSRFAFSGGDISTDGKDVVLRTDRTVYQFHRDSTTGAGNSIGDLLTGSSYRPVQVIAAYERGNRESVAFNDAGDKIYTVSEHDPNDSSLDNPNRWDQGDIVQEVLMYEAGAGTDTVSFDADLTNDGYVDFQDLTILLADWNKTGMVAGNIVNATQSPVDFNDLTVLLVAWTGPGPGGPSPAAMVAHSSTVPISGDPTVYLSSATVTVNFQVAVSGVDASDMVLSGSGGSGASVAAPSEILTGIWSFPVTGLSIGTVDLVLAPDEDDITYTSGGASVDTMEWTFIAMPGVSFSSGALVIEGTSGDDTIDLIAGISTKAWSFKRMPLNTAVYAMSA